MVAVVNTIDAVNKVSAVKNFCPSAVSNKPEALPIENNTKEITITEMIPIPEIGLEEEPTSPAM